MAKMTAFVATLVVFLSLLASTAGASGVAFSDDFESGSLSQWTVRNGATIQQQEVYAGMWAARATSTGGQAYAYKTLSTAQPNLFYDHQFKVLSQGGGNVSVVRFLTSSGGAIFTIMRGPTGRLIYYNQVTGVSTTSTTAVPTGAWHELEVHAFINGSGSSVEVWLDGAKINDLSKTDSLGTTPIGRVLIGDSATGRTFDVAFDNVIVSASSDVTPPVPPTALTATAIASNHVNLTWTAATDNVGVTGYTIYRGGTAIGTVRGTTSGYADFSTSPFITYSYTVDAFDGAGNHSGQSTPASATTPAASGGDPMVMAVGDIACDPYSSSYNNGNGTATECHQRATSDLAFNGNPAAILVLGDNQYADGALDRYQQSFDSSWGRVRSIIHPMPGNHEYLTAAAFGYYTYFGAAAGDPSKGYYSFDVGSWHIVALNSECAQIGGCGFGSPEEAWLQADLAAHSNTCTLAYWHEGRWSSGLNGDYTDKAAFWQDLYAAKVDVVLNGHDHDYERFAPQDAGGGADPSNGIREFVVGTGGSDHTSFLTTDPNSEVRNSDTFGALSLTLHPTSYDWTFVPETGGTFTDSGSASCH